VILFRRRRAGESANGYNQAYAEAEAAENERLDQWDALMAEAHEVTNKADMLAHRLVYGLATLDEARQFMEDTDTSENVYIDLSWLQSTFLMMGGAGSSL
jgi:hypothetical protein